uniref:Heat shock transcription factor A5b n=1 Tax=Populus simonii TaxID=295327 RepID=A0A0N7DK40_9ROSI|nr:heat shock transcription factor A5b [Populus simonii]AKV56405.1 heat shock transcription factor A5b [Populus simonii]
MEAGPSSATSGGGGGGGGPAPFLVKTYDMVDDSSTDEIVSWSSNKNSFVVWNPPEFARLLLPTFFKHINFSSFIRQLNTYGFRKIDPERWEFANEDFVKDQKHLLKNIYRRKPIHSHSQPQGSLVDPEGAAYEEEIEKLARDKAKLKASILGFEQQRSSAKLQVQDLTQKIDTMQQRQEKLLSFLEKADQNPTFVEHLARKIEAMDFSAYSKKRRLPQVDHPMPIAENSLVENHSSSRLSRMSSIKISQISWDWNCHQLFQILIWFHTAHRAPMKMGEAHEEKYLKGIQKMHCLGHQVYYWHLKHWNFQTQGHRMHLKCIQLSQETYQQMGAQHYIHCSRILLLMKKLMATFPVSYILVWHLLLCKSTKILIYLGYLNYGQEIGKSPESRFNESNKDSDIRVSQNNINLGNEGRALSNSQETPNNNQAPASAPVRVNDVFWEQFLTERPGYSDNEEASSSYRANPYDERERRIGFGEPRNARNMEQLSL